MIFYAKDYKSGFTMHCKTEDEAKSFCRYLDSIGRKWIDGQSYLSTTHWEKYREQTCYSINTGVFGSLSFYQKYTTCTILEWSDFGNENEVLQETSKIDKLANRITDEITAFRMSEKKKSVGEIYNDWYEVCIKEELYNLFMNADLDGYEKIISWLNTKEQPLEYLYRAVINSEYGFVHRWDSLLEWLDDLCLNDEND